MNLNIIIAISISVPSLIILYMLRRTRALSKEVSGLKTTGGYLKIIEDAEQEYDKILKDAHTRAQDIIGESVKYIDNMSEAQDEARTAVLKEARKDTDKMMQDISENIKEEVTREIEDFRAVLSIEASKSQAAVRKVIVDENQKVSDEIEAYRKEKIAQIDKSVNSTIRDVSLHVFGKVLSTRDHKTLITKALEEAKAKNVI